MILLFLFIVESIRGYKTNCHYMTICQYLYDKLSHYLIISLTYTYIYVEKWLSSIDNNKKTELCYPAQH